MKCRFCHSSLSNEFVDLINAPPSNSFLEKGQLNEPEVFYPLRLFVCEKCFLVQIDEYKKSGEIFNEDYAYFSSFSSTWLDHARDYVESICERLSLDSQSFVIEIGSNDGYLLQYFQERKIPCLGIEPTKGTAQAAREKDIDVLEDFFGTHVANSMESQGKKADLLIGNNVLAHVPDINDFVKGLKIALKDTGTITMEFPHLMRLVEGNQFDTIYHEHFSYFSLFTVQKIFSAHGLELFDVEELGTHGGSLRIYAGHEGRSSKDNFENIEWLLEKERAVGMHSLSYYQNFQDRVDRVKDELLSFLIEQKRKGKKVVAYGAAAKGNTLLNYCGIRNDLITFVVDISPHKQGKFLPGSHIPIVPVGEITTERPDYVLILPWNIQDEIVNQLRYIDDWGGIFVVPIPDVHLRNFL
ncbi:MAG: methyltransferase domain-containing protein [Deltaproteobacteria bacterium]|nr:methyltransferase domain-containing protein [Deltaproteobacteria bacterium]MBW2119435.1 methyltransferase domain-containing protein [Deltaproteobacteria bacterium]MBW2342548.1 methyltransferase domain-containing protein [Deltaproteobacteria bacterium]